ncbi:non-specific lipid-transfer protein 3-like [Wolffia australiana]
MVVKRDELVFVALALWVLVTSPYANAAVTCGSVLGSISPCFTYVLGRVKTPSLQCCSGVKTVSFRAATKPDRQATCTCLKSIASTNRALNVGRASSLPRLCKVNVPFPISLSVDCTSYEDQLKLARGLWELLHRDQKHLIMLMIAYELDGQRNDIRC